MTSSFKMVPVDVDQLAQFIRKVNGDNRMAAGSLAEHIAEWLAAAPASPQVAQPVAWLNAGTGNVTKSTLVVMDWDDGCEHVQSLYTHADSDEVEQVKKELALCWDDRRKDREEIRVLHAMLADVERERERLQLTCNALDDQNDSLAAEISALRYLLVEVRKKPGFFSGEFILRLDYALSTTAKPEADHE